MESNRQEKTVAIITTCNFMYAKYGLNNTGIIYWNTCSRHIYLVLTICSELGKLVRFVDLKVRQELLVSVSAQRLVVLQ